MDSTKELIAKKIKFLRKSRGFTQAKLAELIGRDTKHISKLEIAGSYPSIETLDRIAKALNVELKEIFDFDDFKNEDDIILDFKRMLKDSNPNRLKLLYKISSDLRDYIN